MALVDRTALEPTEENNGIFRASRTDLYAATAKKGREEESGGRNARGSSHSITPDWLSRQLRQFHVLLSAVSQRRLCTRERRIERGVCLCRIVSLALSLSLPRRGARSRSLSPFLVALPFALPLSLFSSLYFNVSLNRHRHPPIRTAPPPTSASRR